MESLWQDLRYGARMLARNPGFTTVAVLTLALGIGANTTMFSVVNGVLLTPFPYRESDRLVLIRVSIEGRDSLPSVSPPEVIDFRERTQIFSEVAAIRDNSATLTGEGEPVQVQIGSVTPNFLSVLGIEPFLGRNFTAEDAVQGPPSTVIISYGLWQRRFGGDPSIVGRIIQLNSNGTTIIGVLPQDFQLLLPREAGLPKVLDAWWPFGFDFRSAPRFRWMRGIGRLKLGVSYEQGQAAMNTLAQQLIRQYPEYQQQHFEYKVVPLHDDLVRSVRTPVLVLFGAAAFVLLIACANVANLLLARAAGREQEIGIRAALGASRNRIIQQMLTEGALLAILGGAAGFLLALWGIDVLLALAPQNLPRLDAVELDSRVFIFALGASLLTVVLFGLTPALQASRTSLSDTLKGGARTVGGTDRGRVRKLLVVAEIGLSLVLLIGAGLMIRSFLRLQQVRPGFNPENLLTFQIALPFQRYQSPQEVSQFFEQLSRRMEAVPGLEASGGSFPLPLSGRFWTNDYAYDEESEQSWGSLEADNHVILPGYFRSIGARLLAGRTFTWADNAENRKAIIVDEKLAHKAWPGEYPIGKQLKVLLPNNARESMEVIGVVEHIRQDHPGTDGREQTYMLHAHWPLWAMPVTVRSSLPTADVLATIKQEVHSLDKELAVFQIRTMNGYLSEVVASNRFAMFLMTVFASLAVALAAVGLYGTIAYSVAQRNHEIGIRMALGAQPRDIFKLVVGQGMVLALIGVGVGLAASFALTRFLSSLLFGVSATDPLTFAGVSVLLAAVALLACYIPARRATRVDPLVALRYE